MDTLRFEKARITDFHEKTNNKSGENFATVKFIVQMNQDAAEELRCVESVYAQDGKPADNFAGHQLKWRLRESKISIAPPVGATLDFECAQVSGFSIWPDSEDGLEMGFTAKIMEQLAKVEEFFRKHTYTEHLMELIPAQSELPLTSETEEEEPDEEEEEEEDEDDDDEDDVSEDDEEEEEVAAPARAPRKRAATKKTAAKRARSTRR